MEDFLMIAAFAGLFWLFSSIDNAAGKSLGNNRTYPKCGRNGMIPDGGDYCRNGIRGIDWNCPHCGHSFFG